METFADTQLLGDSLPLKSRVTAFVVNADGEPSVECWEIMNMVDSQRVQQLDGSEGTAHMTSLARSRDLDGLDILTWPSYSPIWPPEDSNFEAEWFDLSKAFRCVASEILVRSLPQREVRTRY